MAFHNPFPESVWVPVLIALVLVSAFLLMVFQRRQTKSFPRAARHTRHKTVPSVVLDLPRANENHARWQTLTLRERQVAVLAADGKQNVEIADALRVSPATIATHLKNIYRKLGIHSRRELANLLQDIEPLDDG